MPGYKPIQICVICICIQSVMEFVLRYIENNPSEYPVKVAKEMDLEIQIPDINKILINKFGHKR